MKCGVIGTIGKATHSADLINALKCYAHYDYHTVKAEWSEQLVITL